MVSLPGEPGGGPRKVRIVVDTALNTGAAEYANLGDVAMLQVGVKRLQELWPAARVDVLTESATNLALFCPGANPLPREGRDFWVGDNAIWGNFERILPWATARRVSRVFRLRCPDAFRRLVRLRLRLRDRRNVRPQVDAFIEAMNAADLFVVCGAGGFTDSSRDWNILTLNTIEEAIQRKVPVAMFGQGMGPLDDFHVQRRAREVLPGVSLLGLREGRSGPTVARSFGISPSQIMITGDEAVELAYGARRAEPGEAVGVNLRVASYSNVDRDMIDNLKPVLHEFARRHNVPLIPIPIAFHASANDHLAIQWLLKGFDNRSDGGMALDTPLKVIEQAGRCRIVVTGAYHAAVFALSQGIPVVGLSASDDYRAKFSGLEEQFGLGCETVLLDAADVSKRLAAATERAWDLAGTSRPALLEAARRQIALSQRAYQRAREEVISLEARRSLEK